MGCIGLFNGFRVLGCGLRKDDKIEAVPAIRSSSAYPRVISSTLVNPMFKSYLPHTTSAQVR